MRAALVFVLMTVTIAFAQTEQAEIGHAALPNGSEVSYRIRLLPLESFPQLPASAANTLREKHCMVPQTYEAHEPENVIHGAFEKKGSSDWAVLCAVNGTTTLYAFFASQPEMPVTIRHQQDDKWLGSEQPGVYGSAWGITTRHAGQPGKALHGATFDHDSIEDAFVEKSSTSRYFQNGEWTVLNNGDQK